MIMEISNRYTHIDNGGIETTVEVDDNAFLTMKISTQYFGYPTCSVEFSGTLCDVSMRTAIKDLIADLTKALEKFDESDYKN